MMRVGRSLALVVSCIATACVEEDIVIASWQPVLSDAASGHDAHSDPMLVLPDAWYMEAEHGRLSSELAIGSSADASGGRFVVATAPSETSDMPGLGRGLYPFELGQAGDYVLWGRIHAPGADRNRFWIRIDDGAWFLWRISTGDAWHWDDIHDDTDYGSPIVFALEAGPHELEIANAVVEAKLDRFYVTARGDEPPGNTTPCDPPHSIEIAGNCIRSCGSHGNVSCEPDVCAGRLDLAAYDCAVCCLLE
jgi:hypothetical protein